MPHYICTICAKEFAQKSHYDNHLKRKTPCCAAPDKKMTEVAATMSASIMPTKKLIIKKNAISAPTTPLSTPQQTTPIKFVDLFCGIGSFHYSFKKFGWECVMACDIDASVKRTYQENYGMEPLGDITTIDPSTVPNYDILCAGFPCQPFSQCGQHKGFDDTRGTLFFQIMKFVNHHAPPIIVLENVQALLHHDGGKTFDKIQNDIKNANYSITYKIIKCSDYGLPQMRKRLIIVCVRNDTEIVKHLDKLLEFDEYKKDSSLSELLGKKFEAKNAYTIRCGGKNSPINDRHNWDGYIVDGLEYRLTIEDCLKIQGFDKDFKLQGTIKDQWRQLGNTIPTVFTEIIGKNINKYLW